MAQATERRQNYGDLPVVAGHALHVCGVDGAAESTPIISCHLPVPAEDAAYIVLAGLAVPRRMLLRVGTRA